MIPFITPKILANANALAAEELSFANRAEEIEALPDFLSVYFASPSGLVLLNIGTTEPSERDRNKPWFYNGDPPGLFVWNNLTSAWENVSPEDVTDLLALVESARVTAYETSGGNLWLAKKAADDAKKYDDQAWISADDAVEDADNAKIDADEVYEMYSSATSGFVSGDVGDSALDMSLWPELAIVGDRTNYSPGFVASDWYDLDTPLDPSQPIIGQVMLTANSTPLCLFNYSVQCHANGEQVRLYGYEIFPDDLVLPQPRRVCFNYMLKGVLL